MKNYKNIYNLELHEAIEIKTGPTTYFVIRVPGGWIYENPRLDCGQMTSTFIPFDNGFQTL